jgi:presenilin-like A22 family membrane protease
LIIKEVHGGTVMNIEKFRNKLNPFLIISFLIVGGTGTLMLLHVKTGGVKVLHEWLSIIFVITSILHVILNWKSIICYLKRPISIIALIVMIAISAGLIIMGSGHEGPGGREGRRGPPVSQSDSGNYRQ